MLSLQCLSLEGLQTQMALENTTGVIAQVCHSPGTVVISCLLSVRLCPPLAVPGMPAEVAKYSGYITKNRGFVASTLFLIDRRHVQRPPREPDTQKNYDFPMTSLWHGNHGPTLLTSISAERAYIQ